MKTHSHTHLSMVILVALGLGAPISAAQAQEAAPPPNPETGLVAEQPAAAEPAPAAPVDEAPPEAEPAETAGDKRGLWLFGGKIGAMISLNGLGPYLHGAVEVGYVFPVLDQGIGALLNVEYSAPRTDGHVDEDFDPERVPSGGYDWELLQKELVIMPTFLYRMTFLSDWLTPYAGLGLRVYLLESTVNGTAGDQPIADTTEHSTKVGFGVPLGAEFALGPGGITAELLFQWAPMEHTVTGDSHLGGLSLFVGYRFLL